MDVEPDSDMDTTDAPVVNANGVPGNVCSLWSLDRLFDSHTVH